MFWSVLLHGVGLVKHRYLIWLNLLVNILGCSSYRFQTKTNQPLDNLATELLIPRNIIQQLIAENQLNNCSKSIVLQAFRMPFCSMVKAHYCGRGTLRRWIAKLKKLLKVPRLVDLLEKAESYEFNPVIVNSYVPMVHVYIFVFYTFSITNQLKL